MPDVASASLGLAATYQFWRWLESRRWSSAAATGFILGLALLTKLTQVILIPVGASLWLFYEVPAIRARGSLSRLLRGGVQGAWALLIAVMVLNLGYACQGTFARLGDYQFVSEMLSGSKERIQQGNIFLGTVLQDIPVPLPEPYVTGLDLQQRDFESYPQPSYLRGQWKRGGWWYYYLYALAVKIPLGTWALLAMAVVTSLPLRGNPRQRRGEAVLLAPAVVLLAVASTKTSFNEHMRYVLPVLPFAFIAISRVIVASRSRNATRFILVMLTWSTGSSLWIYPHSLSYFNESVGGPLHGSEHLLGSNVDWGHDLLYLREWIRNHPEAEPMSLAYWGGFNASTLHMSYPTPYQAEELVGGHIPAGWYAVSVNLVRGAPWQGRPLGSFRYFERFPPTARAGYSINIYHIGEDERDSQDVDIDSTP
jgi:4-amino-4-deoxy-L-arabinose transferase-like glycosyltransferase